MRGGGLVDLPGDCSDMQTLGYSWYYDWEMNTSCPNVGVPFVPMQFGGLVRRGVHLFVAAGQPFGLGQPVSPDVQRARQPEPVEHDGGPGPAALAVPGGHRPSARQSGGDRQLAEARPGWPPSWPGPHRTATGSTSSPSTGTATAPIPRAWSATWPAWPSYGLPLWLTEFSCLNGFGRRQRQLHPTGRAQLEALPYLQRIGWFSNRPYPGGYQNTGLLDASGTLSTVGQAYTALPAG